MASSTPIADTAAKDPYTYLYGWNNFHISEAIPGVLPNQLHPQKNKYGLYTEGITGAAFTAPRAENKQAWIYRIQPSVAHDGFTLGKQNPYLVSDFSDSNPKVRVNPTQVLWKPFALPSPNEKIDFIEGLRTLGGSGSARLREGMATHIYLATASMDKKAFVNSDGDFLILPELGTLDIQTEFGKLMVRPGELVIIPSGLKFKVNLPDGPSRGYVNEVYANHFVLPELGVLGSSGLANPGDFAYPVASFDIDQSPWEVVYKITGQLFTCKQDHTPFDVVGWRGTYAPCKYALEKFTLVRNANKDHTDPSSMCLLTVKSKLPNVSVMDFCAIVPHWDVSNAYRAAYYHRNTASELVGWVVTPPNNTNARAVFEKGFMNYQTGYAPHGPPNDENKLFSNMELSPKFLFEGSLGFLLEPSTPLLFTEWALNAPNFVEQDVSLWKGLQPEFLKNLDKVNADLKAAGLPTLM
ncbi:hypothetical protein QCA50_006104 [Cerrena zonata]|uniref:homogentisate 1,2-dioxygenase n=1 Tax=Cerrena zonata TaxID=2478898 RepID=A0AAW0GDR1_9APHY